VTKMTPELLELLNKIELQFPSPMKCVIVGTGAEFDDAIKKMGEKSLRLAAVSNAGLPQPYRRLTFLPASAFTDTPASVSH
jgi:uncharacterized NAD(P)/FAD-binding protein YdhS